MKQISQICTDGQDGGPKNQNKVAVDSTQNKGKIQRNLPLKFKIYLIYNRNFILFWTFLKQKAW